MLKSISWTEFIECIALVLGVYYLVIGLVFYRQPLVGLLQGKWPVNRKEGLKILLDDGAINNKKDLIALLQAAHDLMQETGMIINKGLVREELLYALTGSISNYPQLKGTSLEGVITRFIEVACAEKCSLHLSKEELSGLWKG